MKWMEEKIAMLKHVLSLSEQSYWEKVKADYIKFCNKLLQDINHPNISIEYIDKLEETYRYSVVNFLFEYTSERGYYYNSRIKLQVWYLKDIENPIMRMYDTFLNKCRNVDPDRIK